MKTIKTTIAILMLIVFTICCASSLLLVSCSKEDETKLPSAEASFENTTTIPIKDAIATATTQTDGVTISTINVPINATILDIKKVVLEMNLGHAYANDLSFTLIAPDGTECLFVYRINSFKQYLNQNKLRFSSAFTNSILNENINILAGDYKESPGNWGNTPPALLPIFLKLQGKNIIGTWKLKIIDYFDEHTGSFTSWKLIFQTGALNQ